MTRFRICLFVIGLLLPALAVPASFAAAPGRSPDFNEIRDLIKAHAAGMSDEDLNDAAVQGLLTALGTKVSLVTNSLSTNAPAEMPQVTGASVFEGQIACIRIAQVRAGLAKELSEAHGRLAATNALTGVVLDLRYADGADYAAAAATADLFISKAEPLLNWGAGAASSSAKTNAIQVPVVVLVNHETAGAAEALAALLRETGAGLILGGRTAGRAMVTRDFPLSSGGRLRIAIAPVTLGGGGALPAEGVKPDIGVAVSPEDERAYYENAFVVLPKTNTLAGARPPSANPPGGTNQISRRVRLNEAELVREHQEGMDRDPDTDSPPRAPEPVKPLVTDPALARALDLVKGLALVRRRHQ